MNEDPEVRSTSSKNMKATKNEWFSQSFANNSTKPDNVRGPSFRGSSSAEIDWHGHTLQLKTSISGFNAGRIYYIKAQSASTEADLLDNLLNSIREAKIRVERKSRFEKSQEAVRSVQESHLFQMTVASLILLVSDHNTRPSSPQPSIPFHPRQDERIARTGPTRRPDAPAAPAELPPQRRRGADRAGPRRRPRRVHADGPPHREGGHRLHRRLHRRARRQRLRPLVPARAADAPALRAGVCRRRRTRVSVWSDGERPVPQAKDQ